MVRMVHRNLFLKYGFENLGWKKGVMEEKWKFRGVPKFKIQFSISKCLILRSTVSSGAPDHLIRSVSSSHYECGVPQPFLMSFLGQKYFFLLKSLTSIGLPGFYISEYLENWALCVQTSHSPEAWNPIQSCKRTSSARMSTSVHTSGRCWVRARDPCILT